MIEVSRDRMTAERFKELFKVGDVIAGYATMRHMLITGIGDTRFFYRDPEDRKDKEYMAMQHIFPWVLVSRGGVKV
jgi:hypothetical protein